MNNLAYNVLAGLIDMSGKVRDVSCFEPHRLIPLGDKKTQDEL